MCCSPAANLVLSLVVAAAACSFFLVASALQLHAAGASCIPRERDALLAFKRGINDTYGSLASWQQGGRQDCCGWAGVTCSNVTGHVHKLDLGGLYLAGQLESSTIDLCEDEKELLHSKPENKRREKFESLFNLQQERNTLIEPRKDLAIQPGIIQPGMYVSLPPSETTTAATGDNIDSCKGTTTSTTETEPHSMKNDTSGNKQNNPGPRRKNQLLLPEENLMANLLGRGANLLGNSEQRGQPAGQQRQRAQPAGQQRQRGQPAGQQRQSGQPAGQRWQRKDTDNTHQ